jgi:lipase
LPLPPGMTAEEATAATIGPASARLSMTFPTREAYYDFWRQHPAFAGGWNADVQAYVDYDLVGEEPDLHASGAIAAIAEDSAQLQGDDGYLGALESLPAPVHFLRAERGMLDQPVGLYPPAAVAEWAARIPALVVHEVPGVNHYTIVLSTEGAAAIADVVGHLIPST